MHKLLSKILTKLQLVPWFKLILTGLTLAGTGLYLSLYYLMSLMMAETSWGIYYAAAVIGPLSVVIIIHWVLTIQAWREND